MKVLAVGMILFLGSCTFSEHRRDVVARVGDEYLYDADLAEMFPEQLTGEDSVAVRGNFIRNWVREQIIYQQALGELTGEEKNKDKELEDYYRSLIQFEYEKKMLNNILDTAVTDAEIEEYYNNNLKNFELKRNIIRLFYVKVPDDAPRLEDVEYWMRYPESTEPDTLRQYAEQFAASFNLDTAKWFYFDEVAEEVPIIEIYKPEHFVRSNKFVELRDSSHLYLLHIVDKRIRDDVAPLSLERDRIRDILRNQRRKNALMRLERRIYTKALQEKEAEIF